MTAGSGDPLFMTSLARGLSVIRVLMSAETGLTIAELSRATGLHRAVVRRCLYTLGELGYATREGCTYGLSPAVLSVGYAHAAAPGSDAAVRLLAVPVRDALGKTIAALEMRVQAARMSREDLLNALLPVLKGAAVALGRGLSLRAATPGRCAAGTLEAVAQRAVDGA